MRKNPLNKGIIMENAAGIGTVTSEMVEARARELAAINGHPSKPSKADYQQAKRELTGEAETDPQEEIANPYPNRRVGIPCRARPDGKQQTPSEKTKMPRDGARVRRCSKKASPKRSTIKCVRHPGQKGRATNQSHNSRAPSTTFASFACHVQSPRRVAFFYALLRGLTYFAARSARPSWSPWRPRRANAFGARAGDDDELVFDSRHKVLGGQNLQVRYCHLARHD